MTRNDICNDELQKRKGIRHVKTVESLKAKAMFLKGNILKTNKESQT